MRLTKAEFSGFGRLAQGKINLDNKVIAIVGPNEAGKSTLLKALAYLDNGQTLSVPERSRGMAVPDNHTVINLQYILGDDDRAALVDLALQEDPHSIWISRNASENTVFIKVEPTPAKAVAPLEASLKQLFKASTKRELSALTIVTGSDAVGLDPDPSTFSERVAASIGKLKAGEKESDAKTAANRSSTEISTLIKEFEKYELGGPILEGLLAVTDWLSRTDPGQEVRNRLYKRRPKILLFSEEDRTLSSAYLLNEDVVKSPPRALANLCQMAELELSTLWKSITQIDPGERETLILKANQKLAKKFSEAWKQSDVTVHLKIQGEELAVLILQDQIRITQFDERSEGLRMFVALVMFLGIRDLEIRPILLIDEAETHLHIDAQADLVNTFMKQEQAAKIIYTTHSPACLPPDLGSNIRAVLPDLTKESRSVITGSFWHNAAGFSPLMLAMGAGAAAFSAARYVVLAEGASEMLLLPSLIKAAVGLADLDYQVAPGISEMPPSLYPDLDLEGARVAYLVDGDEGGKSLKSRLILNGVPPGRVVELKAPTLENLLDSDSYLTVVRRLLIELNPGKTIPALPKLKDFASTVWPVELKKWADKGSLNMPNKRFVASQLVEDGLAKPSAQGIAALKALHEQLEQILKTK